MKAVRELIGLAAMTGFERGFKFPSSAAGKQRKKTYSTSMNQRQKRKRWRQSPYLRSKYA